MEDDDGAIDDPMVVTALQYLHGFGLRRDPGNASLVSVRPDGPWLHDDDAIRSGLARWRARCVEFDRDPAGYVARIRQENTWGGDA